MDVTGLLAQIAQQSLLGILLVLAFVVIYLMYKEIRDLQNKRIADALELRDKFVEPFKSMQQTLELILTLLQTTRKRSN